jgi:hypothetical protein
LVKLTFVLASQNAETHAENEASVAAATALTAALATALAAASAAVAVPTVRIFLISLHRLWNPKPPTIPLIFIATFAHR